MTRMKVVHETGFRYQGDALASYNEARMQPMIGGHQWVLSSELEISPSAHVFSFTDYWRTRVAAFEVLVPHGELTLTATSLVETQDQRLGLQQLDWEGIERVARWKTPIVETLALTPLTRAPEDVVELARELASNRSPGEAAEAICLALGDLIEYLPGATTVTSTAAEVWEKRSGVCQDIAHLCLAALRSVDIPARYASGYVNPKSDAELGEPVSGESHAWVEWFTGQWNGFDPTNATPISSSHVVVGRGRDYNDVPPLRGVYSGPDSSELFVSVTVTLEA